MECKRRQFLKNMPLLALGLGRSPASPSLSFEQELRMILCESPHLFHFRANNGHFAKVYLDGRRCEKCTEYVADPHPGVPKRGAVRLLITNKRGRLLLSRLEPIREWKIGTVVWFPWKDFESANQKWKSL